MAPPQSSKGTSVEEAAGEGASATAAALVSGTRNAAWLRLATCRASRREMLFFSWLCCCLCWCLCLCHCHFRCCWCITTFAARAVGGFRTIPHLMLKTVADRSGSSSSGGCLWPAECILKEVGNRQKTIDSV